MIVVALFVCLAAIAARIPAAVRGRGRLSLAALVMLAAAIALAMPAGYLLVDGWLGNHNFANLIVRLLVFGFATVFALSLARVFDAYRVEEFVRGPGGVAAIVGSMLVLGFALGEMGALSYSSPGLVAFNGSHWFRVYSLIGHLYPSILAGVLIAPVMRFVVSPSRARVMRVGYGLMAFGMGMLVLLSILYLGASVGLLGVVQPVIDAVAWSAPITVVAGALWHAIGSWVTRRTRFEAPARAEAQVS